MSRKTKAFAQRKKEEAKKRRLLSRLAAALMIVGVLLLGAGAMMKSYPAGEAALAAMKGADVQERVTVFASDNPRAGMIFYPGGLVQHEAYAPLMRALADRGISCILTRMPLDLAVLRPDAADGLKALLPQIDAWIIGGHSLGGAMAADYAAKHPGAFDALVLLGAYSTADLSETDMQVLSVVGSEDGVLNREKYDACRKNYPPSFREFTIEGGCHAFFGDYGAQKGDGTPRISREMQTGMTASAIASLLQ